MVRMKIRKSNRLTLMLDYRLIMLQLDVICNGELIIWWWNGWTRGTVYGLDWVRREVGKVKYIKVN